MSGAGRNEPCPCGSGLKSKKCCGGKQRGLMNPSAPGAPLHQRDERLVNEMVRYAHARWGPAWLQVAADAYFDDAETQPHEAHLQLFMPWVVNYWDVEGRPVREWFLEERGTSLSQEDVEWLRGQRAVVLTLWEVLEVQPGVGVRVRELLGREEHFVQEVLGSQQLHPRDAVLGRVAESAGITVFCGLYPHPLPPLAAHEVVKTVRRELRVHGNRMVSRKKLVEEDTTLGLVLLWRGEVEFLEEQARLGPRLTNTDGDPFILVEDHYTFAPEARPRVVERLAALEGAEWEEAEGGEEQCTFLKEGNAMHASWQNTVIGRARFQATTLRLETNSVRRADALRRRVEAACQGLITHQSREETQPSKLREGPPPPPEEPRTPERLEALREMKARHYAAWLDTKLPALQGRSPRQAVGTVVGRREVDAMLKDVENREARLPAEERMDVTGLRRELGLEP